MNEIVGKKSQCSGCGRTYKIKDPEQLFCTKKCEREHDLFKGGVKRMRGIKKKRTPSASHIRYRFFCNECEFNLLSPRVLPKLKCECGCLAECEELNIVDPDNKSAGIKAEQLQLF